MTGPAERKGSLMRWTGECGHTFVVYSLEPTPEVCPECQDASRKILTELVRDIGWGKVDELPGDDEELDQWLDESGVHELAMREDIRRIAALCDDIRAAIDHAEVAACKMLEKYPEAERLTMPA